MVKKFWKIPFFFFIICSTTITVEITESNVHRNQNEKKRPHCSGTPEILCQSFAVTSHSNLKEKKAINVDDALLMRLCLQIQEKVEGNKTVVLKGSRTTLDQQFSKESHYEYHWHLHDLGNYQLR